MAYCVRCRGYFLASASWAKLCKTCYIESKREELQDWMDRAQRAESMLAEKQTAASIDPTLIRKLLQLCHPDKHQGSSLANEVTQTLLAMKGRR